MRLLVDCSIKCFPCYDVIFTDLKTFVFICDVNFLKNNINCRIISLPRLFCFIHHSRYHISREVCFNGKRDAFSCRNPHTWYNLVLVITAWLPWSPPSRSLIVHPRPTMHIQMAWVMWVVFMMVFTVIDDFKSHYFLRCHFLHALQSSK